MAMSPLRVLAPAAKAAVWAHLVLVTPPSLDQYLGLSEAVEDLTVEQLVAQRAVEALIVDWDTPALVGCTIRHSAKAGRASAAAVAPSGPHGARSALPAFD